MAARRAALLGCGALVALAACAPSDARTGSAVQVRADTVGGVIHLVSSGEPPSWTLEPVRTLASAGEEEFGEVSGLVLAGDGSAFVADHIAKRIYHFSPDGEFVAALGREGAGPGEFRSLRSLAWVGDYLATLDAGNGRITTVSTTGTPGPVVRWLALTGQIALEQTAADEAYALLPVFDEERRGSSDQVFLRITGTGVTDTLPGRRYQAEGTATGVLCEGRGMLTFFSVPESPRPYDARGPDRLTVLARTGEYRFALVGAAGDTVRVIQRDIPNPPLLDSDWAETQALWSAFQERTRSMRCNRTSIERPATKAAFASTFFDDRGRLWVEARDTVGYRFDVFDREGRLVGQLPAPDSRDRRIPPHVRGDRMAFVARDSLDLQTVHVSRIVERGGGR